mmetsp:Transcript_56849/g.114137  ORF Transcript_56849/g.114137 Transcript_56849/m.114137 type:complete len:275 (+) Transcript_56849:474-1298(+)
MHRRSRTPIILACRNSSTANPMTTRSPCSSSGGAGSFFRCSHCRKLMAAPTLRKLRSPFRPEKRWWISLKSAPASQCWSPRRASTVSTHVCSWFFGKALTSDMSSNNCVSTWMKPARTSSLPSNVHSWHFHFFAFPSLMKTPLPQSGHFRARHTSGAMHRSHRHGLVRMPSSMSAWCRTFAPFHQLSTSSNAQMPILDCGEISDLATTTAMSDSERYSQETGAPQWWSIFDATLNTLNLLTCRASRHRRMIAAASRLLSEFAVWSSAPALSNTP